VTRFRTALSFLRRQRPQEPWADGPTTDRLELVEALATLPSAQRRAMVLHYLGDMSVNQIAAREGVPAGTVKSWLHRGRTGLAAHLQPTTRPEVPHA
jgi:RNA polymerase sigma-70 factor (ECF subfamily)